MINICHHFTPYLCHEIVSQNPLEIYRDYCHAQELAHDPAQEEILKKLLPFHDSLQNRSWRNLGNHLTAKIKAEKPIKGCYLYGASGAGKSMIMGFFLQSAPTHKKMRIHFHEFMIHIHRALEDIRQSHHHAPLKIIAKDIAKICDLICFDEFQVTDVADAMILKNLFEALFAHKIILFATSNIAPDALYQDGLQRGQFLPFIPLLKTHCEIYPLEAKCDYRISTQTPFWHLTQKNGRQDFEIFYQKFTKNFGRGEANTHYRLLGVDLPLIERKKRSIKVQFSDLCDNFISAEDYLALCQEFDNFFIVGIPILVQEDRNSLKRFINLIDILYEHHKNLFCLAQTTPQKTYQGASHAKEFKRTISRLLEMEEYQWIK